MQKSDLTRLQTYLRAKFGNQTLTVTARKEDPESAEVKLGDEFMGVIYRDEDEGEISFDFNMAILEIDLPEAA